jgi:5-hydroxyisourate hydrolase/2-oxo-4-hydroxy-4-carboxy-5-ureidoimidazoline decarboxylase
MHLQNFNQFSPEKAAEFLFSCCGSRFWVEKLLAFSPFSSERKLLEKTTEIWYEQCSQADWLESFLHHPKIGDLSRLKEKFAGKEQAGVDSASDAVIEKLAVRNQQYEAQNGFIFIVCATGKSAEEMLHLLEDRLQNSREEELKVAMGEQQKITLIRLQKLLPDADWSILKSSHITTHVLDTSLGKTGKNICIRLKDGIGNVLAQGRTNADGRIPDLLPGFRFLPPGPYHMVFDTGAYYQSQNQTGFYPEVDIQFTVFDSAHYHIPLLINPFGYSTYRGS